jgi:arylformamidase
MTPTTSKIAMAVLLTGVAQSGCAGQNRSELMERAAARREAARAEGKSGTAGTAGMRVEHDIAYGSDPAQRLDVYRPEHAANATVIFMVHGGGWTRGDKGASNVVGNKVKHWVPDGFVFISVNYRLSPAVNPLEQANDVARALAFAQSHSAGWGADPSRFVLVGHSAGGHLVSLLTADRSIATRQGARPWLGTISLDAAGYDIVKIMESPRHLRLYDPVFGEDRDLWRAASPALRLEQATVPLLLVCSSKRVVSCPQARGFADKATSLGGRAKVLPIDMTHDEINELLGADSDYTSDVDVFIRSLGVK